MKRTIAVIAAMLALMLGAAALGEGYRVADGNDANFGALLTELVRAYEHPSDGDAQAIEAALEAIQSVSEADYEVASAIAGHWQAVCLNQDYPLYLYRGGEFATELEQAAPEISNAHAFVVLGFELQNGEMTTELMGRCAAAAAAARSYPDAIIVCSGGATGKNNPKKHTEAGLMRDFLVEACRIDPSRIIIDEKAQDTLQNAVNTFAMLRANDIETFTVITSSYHQVRGQVLYNAMAAIYRQLYGYDARLVGNYSYEVDPGDRNRGADRVAAQQLAKMLRLSDATIDRMKQSLK